MSHNSANAFNRPFQNSSLSFESAGSLFQLKQEHAVYSPTLNEIPLHKWISSNTCVCVEGGGGRHARASLLSMHKCTRLYSATFMLLLYAQHEHEHHIRNHTTIFSSFFFHPFTVSTRHNFQRSQ